MLNYNGNNISFEYVCQALSFDDQIRDDFFQFLKANRELIEDESIIGVLDYLEQYNDDFSKLESKVKILSGKNYSKNHSQRYRLTAITLLALFVFWLVLSPSDNDSLFEPLEIGVVNLLNSNDSSSNWKNFAVAYNKEKYSKAMSILNEMPNSTSIDSLNYFKGVLSYKLKVYDDSISQFEKVLLIDESIFYYDSQYFIALGYFKTKQYDKCKLVLEQIISDDYHPFHKEAIGLFSNIPND